MLRYTRGWLHFDVSVNKCYYYYYPTRGSSPSAAVGEARGRGRCARPNRPGGLCALSRPPSALSAHSTARASTTLASSLRVSCKFPVVSVTFHHHPPLRNLLNLPLLLALPAAKESFVIN